MHIIPVENDEYLRREMQSQNESIKLGMGVTREGPYARGNLHGERMRKLSHSLTLS